MLHMIEVVAAGDPGGGALAETTREIIARLAPGFEIQVREGTPSQVLINGHLIGPRNRPAGETPAWMIEAAVAHALEPKHILFMCVANSARSQLAECMARALAPAGVVVSSAGSEPSAIRTEALSVLEELNLDASDQRAKSVAEIDADTVQLLITLCAEEVCPTLLRPVPHVHWAMPDPAAVEGDDATRLAAFREVREALRARLYVLFNG